MLWGKSEIWLTGEHLVKVLPQILLLKCEVHTVNWLKCASLYPLSTLACVQGVKRHLLLTPHLINDNWKRAQAVAHSLSLSISLAFTCLEMLITCEFIFIQGKIVLACVCLCVWTCVCLSDCSIQRLALHVIPQHVQHRWHWVVQSNLVCCQQIRHKLKSS